MTAVVLILLMIVIAFVLTRKRQDSGKEEMHIRQRVYLEPLKSVTTLSMKLFDNDETRNMFKCMLLQTICTCMAEETKMRCSHNPEAMKIIVDFYDTLKITIRKSLNCDMELDFIHDTWTKMYRNAGARYKPIDLLMPVFQAYRADSKVTDECYAKLIDEWYRLEFIRFSDLNTEFRKYVIQSLKAM